MRSEITTAEELIDRIVPVVPNDTKFHTAFSSETIRSGKQATFSSERAGSTSTRWHSRCVDSARRGHGGNLCGTHSSEECGSNRWLGTLQQ